jgi:hypothetical protein
MGQGTAQLDLQQAITWLAEGRVQLRDDIVPYLFRLSEDAVWKVVDHLVPDVPHTGLQHLSEKLKELAGGDSYKMAAAALLKAQAALASAWPHWVFKQAVKPLFKQSLDLLPAVPADQQSARHKTIAASCLLGMATCGLAFPDWWASYRESSLALQLQQEVWGPHHPGTLTATWTKAISAHGAGPEYPWYPEAEDLLRRAWEMGEEQLGSAHPETHTACTKLAQWLWKHGGREEATNLGYVEEPQTHPALELLYNFAEGQVYIIARRALVHLLPWLGN